MRAQHRATSDANGILYRHTVSAHGRRPGVAVPPAMYESSGRIAVPSCRRLRRPPAHPTALRSLARGRHLLAATSLGTPSHRAPAQSACPHARTPRPSETLRRSYLWYRLSTRILDRNRALRRTRRSRPRPANTVGPKSTSHAVLNSSALVTTKIFPETVQPPAEIRCHQVPKSGTARATTAPAIDPPPDQRRPVPHRTTSTRARRPLEPSQP